MLLLLTVRLVIRLRLTLVGHLNLSVSRLALWQRLTRQRLASGWGWPGHHSSMLKEREWDHPVFRGRRGHLIRQVVYDAGVCCGRILFQLIPCCKGTTDLSTSFVRARSSHGWPTNRPSLVGGIGLAVDERAELHVGHPGGESLKRAREERLLGRIRRGGRAADEASRTCFVLRAFHSLCSHLATCRTTSDPSTATDDDDDDDDDNDDDDNGERPTSQSQ
jgi:hypothetical protein